MRVVFRADASVKIGAGHIMRCLTLAETLKSRGMEIQFVCRDYLGNLNAMIQERGILVTSLPTSLDIEGSAGQEAGDAEQTIYALGASRPDWLIVDHYGLNIEWERRLKLYVGRIMVIDDMARKHDCEVLLDQNYSEDDARYDGLVPGACKLLLGPHYALLRKEFRVLRKQIEPRSKLENVLLFFTSGDDQGETLKAMRGVEIFGRTKRVDVVVGRANPNNDAIQKRCDELHWGYHCQVDYMPALIAQADLVIGAGGSSNWERCALGVPAVVVILAENQASIAHSLDRAGVVLNLGWGRDLSAADYANALALMDHKRLAAMSEEALKLVDAKGAERVSEILVAGL